MQYYIICITLGIIIITTFFMFNSNRPLHIQQYVCVCVCVSVRVFGSVCQLSIQ